ncbi:MAG: ABC transporter ATP-binding protein [Gammaproteobacteria bacterium]|nr:ABC transporter ATP-binding protein [Gammaproteobacteria bacterium]
MSATPPLLSLDHIECRYDDTVVVRDLSFALDAGQITCLLGPSGCGKTTVLRAIAGFEPVQAGEIRLNGEVISRPGYSRPPEHRGLGMVFQDYALFPHLSVADNIVFGLRRRSRADKAAAAGRLLELVGLHDLGARFPHELSGGQQQRVALARALAPEPPLILLDEPFSNLDVDLRERLSREVRDILKAAGTAGILVTHDQHEAFAMGECIGVMERGRVLQCASPHQLYHEPASRFVADFIGQGVFLKGRTLDSGRIETEIGRMLSTRPLDVPAGTSVDVLLRPDDVVPDDLGSMEGTVIDRAFKGAEILYTLALPSGTRLLALFPSHRNHQPGDTVRIHLDAEHVIAFPRQGAD